MKYGKLAFLTLLLMIMGMITGVARADAIHGSREEAQALCEKAAALVKSDGVEKAATIFQAKDGGFIDRDLYVYVLDSKGVFLAHGGKPVLVGKGSIDMTDVDGFAFIKAFVEVKDKAWVDYKWPDPSDNKIKAKSSYIIRVGDDVVGVGYYKI